MSESQIYLLMITTSIVWIIIPFLVMAFLPVLSDGRMAGADGVMLTLSMFILVWAHDTFAYLTGLAIGKRKLVPSISPAKTIEGAIGGVVFTFIFSILINQILITGTPLIFWLGGSVVIVLFSNLGDLAESKLKRLAEVKDSGRGMPGHGGFFDRFDALIATAPAWLVWVLIMT